MNDPTTSRIIILNKCNQRVSLPESLYSLIYSKTAANVMGAVDTIRDNIVTNGLDIYIYHRMRENPL
jgi:hypothetical protein